LAKSRQLAIIGALLFRRSSALGNVWSYHFCYFSCAFLFTNYRSAYGQINGRTGKTVMRPI